jgi:hypothetical protein
MIKRVFPVPQAIRIDADVAAPLLIEMPRDAGAQSTSQAGIKIIEIRILDPQKPQSGLTHDEGNDQTGHNHQSLGEYLLHSLRFTSLKKVPPGLMSMGPRERKYVSPAFS